MKHAATGLLALVALTAACSSSASGPSATDERRTRAPTTDSGAVVQQVRVTGDGDEGPEACQPAQVGRQVVGFFGVVNSGEAERAADFFTSELGWYSVTEGDPRDGGRHFVARDPDQLDDYFQKRVGQNERMYLIEIDVQYERARNIAHVAYNLHRTADDLTEYSMEAGGKGAIDCDNGRISVWSMAQGHGPITAGDLCPREADPPRAGIACARK